MLKQLFARFRKDGATPPAEAQPPAPAQPVAAPAPAAKSPAPVPAAKPSPAPAPRLATPAPAPAPRASEPAAKVPAPVAAPAAPKDGGKDAGAMSSILDEFGSIQALLGEQEEMMEVPCAAVLAKLPPDLRGPAWKPSGFPENVVHVEKKSLLAQLQKGRVQFPLAKFKDELPAGWVVDKEATVDFDLSRVVRALPTDLMSGANRAAPEMQEVSGMRDYFAPKQQLPKDEGPGAPKPAPAAAAPKPVTPSPVPAPAVAQAPKPVAPPPAPAPVRVVAPASVAPAPVPVAPPAPAPVAPPPAPAPVRVVAPPPAPAPVPVVAPAPVPVAPAPVPVVVPAPVPVAPAPVPVAPPPPAPVAPPPAPAPVPVVAQASVAPAPQPLAPPADEVIAAAEPAVEAVIPQVPAAAADEPAATGPEALAAGVTAEGVWNGVEQGTGAGTRCVDLNQATVEDLQNLPSVGLSRAQSIIAFRNERGGFRSVFELGDIPGIGDASFRSLTGLSLRTRRNRHDILNELLGFETGRQPSLGEITAAANKVCGTAACMITDTDGMPLATAGCDQDLAEQLAANVPQFFRRTGTYMHRLVSAQDVESVAFPTGKPPMMLFSADGVYLVLLFSSFSITVKQMEKIHSTMIELSWLLGRRGVVRASEQG